LLTALAFGGCTCEDDVSTDTGQVVATTSVEPEAPAGGRLGVDASEYDFASNPDVLDRVVRSRYAYFRFISVPWGQAVCDEFEASLNVFPMVNLHGDAHIEQYAITEGAYGLDDFDRATVGPSVIDLVRFGGSLALTAELKGWTDSTDDLIAAFLDGYREALDDPETAETRPSIVARLGDRHDRSPEEFLTWAESLMAPISDDDMPGIEDAVAGFGDLMCEQRTELAREFFTLKRFGRLTLGIGSGLVTKYLGRVEGLSPDPLDDMIIEFKEVQPGQPSCTVQVTAGGMLRPIVGDARLGRAQGRILGFVPVPPDVENDGISFWAKSWEAGYHEVELPEIESPEELLELAHDVGLQLGKGHVRHIAEPVTPQLRRAQLNALDRTRDRVAELSKELAGDVTRAWTDLRRQVERDDAEQSY